MRIKNVLILGIIGLIIFVIIIFSCNGNRNKLTYRLTWFELQIAPMEYRFAIMPNQPILIGSIGENKVTLLIRYEVDPNGYDETVDKVDQLVKELGILKLPQVNSEKCFNDISMEKESIHLRFMYSDNTSWSSYYELSETPPQLLQLIERTKNIGLAAVNRETNRVLDYKEVDEIIDPKNNRYNLKEDGVVLKIYINENAQIEMNGIVSTRSDFLKQLDLLKDQNGVVWYSRYNPENDPEEKALILIQDVLDEIGKRKLPFKLN